jgi:hypothetical protein
MKLTFYILISIFFLTGCAAKTSHKSSACNCCVNSYSSLESATNCISQTLDGAATTDKRLLLFAFVSKDVQSNQKIGWNIIKDQDIIDIAKEKYLLIIQDANDINFLERQMDPELISKIKAPKGQPYFLITNQSLYPFADWTSDETKDIIIDRLQVGDGP